MHCEQGDGRGFLCSSSCGTHAPHRTSTEACRVCCEIIARHTGGIKQCLNGKNEDNVFVDLGQRIYTTLVDHFKTLTVNEMGAMLLIRDLNEYEQCINGFKV